MTFRFFVVGAAAVLGLSAQTPTPDTLFQSGIRNLQGLQFEAAEKAFRGVMEAEPESIRGVVGVTQVLMAQTKTQEAVALLEGELEKQPKRTDIRILLGDTLVRVGRPATALSQYQKALDGIDFRSASDLYVRRGLPAGTYFRSDSVTMVNQSLAVLGASDSTPKGSAGIYFRMAEVRISQGDFDRASESLQKARALQPRDKVVLASLAIALEGAHRIPAAIEAYRATVGLDPDEAISLNNLAFLIADDPKTVDEAWRYAKHASELRPQSTDITDTLGWVALRKGLSKEAAGIFAQALLEQPRRTDLRKHLLMAMEKLASPTPEMSALMEALQVDPARESQEQTQKLVDRLRKIDKPAPIDKLPN